MRHLVGTLILLSAAGVAGCAFGQQPGPVDRYGGGHSYMPSAQAAGPVLSWPGKTAPAPSSPYQGYYPGMQPYNPAQMRGAPYGAVAYPQGGYYPQTGYAPAGYQPSAYPQAAYPQVAYPPAPQAAPQYAPQYSPQYTPQAAPQTMPQAAPASIYAPPQGQTGTNTPATSTPAASGGRALASASAPRFYSLHRDFGIQPDGAPAAENTAAATATADPIPQAFFGSSQLSDSDGDDAPSHETTTTTTKNGTTTTTRRSN